eukprot:TRINITY_DN134_c0_g1_i10.p1 TRINITY_DN134_c0_g1~~TRINITY_DN134_c0_g1_i10.p1  ORF type:complete len:249 (+),score=51.64 TRINITY_DN134_c0_g1_i10:423-1169(+)
MDLLEQTNPEAARKLACGHTFHPECVAGYSCSQPSTPTLPCPACRHPFNAFHDRDEHGHAQARALLSSPNTALHMGIRHVRPADPSTVASSDQGSTSKRDRDPLQPSVSRKCRAIENAVDTSPMVTGVIQDALHSINSDLAELVLQRTAHQQAVNVLQNASLTEILESLPDPSEASQTMQRHRQHKRRHTASARAKRRKERQRLHSMENAARSLMQQQAELQQHWLELSARNEILTAQLITNLVNASQ